MYLVDFFSDKYIIWSSNVLHSLKRVTKVMLFSHRIVTEPTNFTINNIKIEQVGEDYKEKFTKFLGFHLDENLSWKYHIEEIRKKASSGAYILYAKKKSPWHKK